MRGLQASLYCSSVNGTMVGRGSLLLYIGYWMDEEANVGPRLPAWARFLNTPPWTLIRHVYVSSKLHKNSVGKIEERVHKTRSAVLHELPR